MTNENRYRKSDRRQQWSEEDVTEDDLVEEEQEWDYEEEVYGRRSEPPTTELVPHPDGAAMATSLDEPWWGVAILEIDKPRLAVDCVHELHGWVPAEVSDGTVTGWIVGFTGYHYRRKTGNFTVAAWIAAPEPLSQIRNLTGPGLRTSHAFYPVKPLTEDQREREQARQERIDRGLQKLLRRRGGEEDGDQ